MTELFLKNCIELEDPAEHPEVLDGLGNDRRKRILRFRSAADRKRSLAAGILLKEVLPGYGLQPEDIVTDAKGRPGIAGNRGLSDPTQEMSAEHSADAGGFGMDFSLSHSGDYAMLVVSDVRVGCDIERVRSVRKDIAGRFCSDGERRWIAGSETDEERRITFFRIWTARESYMKYTGQGLSLGFARYEIAPELHPADTTELHPADARDSCPGGGPTAGNAENSDSLVIVPNGVTFLGYARVISKERVEPVRIWQGRREDYIISVCIGRHDTTGLESS